MNFNEFPKVNTQINKTNMQDKLKESHDLNIEVEKWKANGGVIEFGPSFGSAPRHCSYKNVNDSYHLS